MKENRGILRKTQEMSGGGPGLWYYQVNEHLSGFLDIYWGVAWPKGRRFLFWLPAGLIRRVVTDMFQVEVTGLAYGNDYAVAYFWVICSIGPEELRLIIDSLLEYAAWILFRCDKKRQEKIYQEKIVG